MKYRVYFDAQVTWATLVEADSKKTKSKAVELMSSEMLAVHDYNVLMMKVEND